MTIVSATTVSPHGATGLAAERDQLVLFGQPACLRMPRLTRTKFLGPTERRAGESSTIVEKLPRIPATDGERLQLLCHTVLNHGLAQSRQLAARLLQPKPKGSREIRCWFDGSYQAGHATIGALVKQNGQTIFSTSRYIGHGAGMSGEVAEFQAAIALFRYLLAEGFRFATAYGDSQLVIDTLEGRIRAKNGLYLAHYQEAYALRRKLPDVRLARIPRNQNIEADALARAALKAFP